MCFENMTTGTISILLFSALSIFRKLPGSLAQDARIVTQHRPYLAGAAIIRNDGAYLAEWLEFHRNIGFEYFLLYDHNSTDNTRSALTSFVAEKFVQVFNANSMFPNECPVGNNRQETCHTSCIQHAIEILRTVARWLAVFDVSEFFFPDYVHGLPQHSVSAILRKLEQHDIVNVIGSVFGTKSKQVSRKDPNSFVYPLVTETYQHRSSHVYNSSWGSIQFAPMAIGNPSRINSTYNHTFTCLPNQSCKVMTIAPLGVLRMAHFQYKDCLPNQMKKHVDNIDTNTLRLSTKNANESNAFFNSVFDEVFNYLTPALRRSLMFRLSGRIPPLPQPFTPEYDPFLYIKKPVFGVDHPETPADICVVFLSCHRLDVLRRSVTAFINYMVSNEPWLTYSIVILDNGSEGDATAILAREIPFDTLIRNIVNQGIGAAMNSLFFGVCRSPYILSLEEDWEARSPWPKEVPALSMAMAVLEQDSKVLEVWLRDHTKKGDHGNISSWISTKPAARTRNAAVPAQVEYKRQAAGRSYGAYTNGASLKHRERLLSVGRFTGVDGEEKFARKVKTAGFTAALLCTNTSHHCEPDFIPYESLFKHIGRVRSPGHYIFFHNVRYGTANW
jgi:hypothetical protein